MKSLYRILVVLCFTALYSSTSFGSHLTGGDFNWTCVGQDSFLVNLNLFRDCSGVNAPLNANVNFTSTCGGNFNVLFALQNTGGTQVSQLCPGQLPFSSCSGGTMVGNQIFQYQALVVLNPPCPTGTWTMSFSTCCRPGGVININNSQSSGLYIQALMNYANDSCNNSPAFLSNPAQYPLQYVCQGTQFNYNFGVTEPDGDSLRYSFVAAQTSATANVNYVSPYTAQVPIVGITLDPATGQISFNVGQTIGTYVVKVKVDEYRRCTGEHLSSIYRDIQFVVVPPGSSSCAAPQDTLGFVNSNFSGTASLIDSANVEMCVGQNFTATLNFFDLDTGQVVSLTSNLTSVLPGATMTTTGTNPVTATISYTALPGTPASNKFTITAVDNSCPTPRISTYTYNVIVLEGVYAGTDVTICGQQSATLSATGGNSFNWSVISGDPIVVGVNFSCDTCGTVTAQPSVTTQYQVIGFSTGSSQGVCNVNLLTCNSFDTITVNVVPDFTLTTELDTALCVPDSIQFTTFTPPGSYTYLWDNSTTLTNDAIPNPVAFPTQTTTYTVTVSSAAGCVKQSSNTITITPPFPPIVEAVANDPILCDTNATQLSVTLGAIIPQSCGASTSPCVGPDNTADVGTGAFSNFGNVYPAPYGGSFRTARHQLLYRASELNAAGIQGGKITAIGFNVAQVNGSPNYNNYTIKIGCTSLQALVNGWQGGLVQAFDPKPITITTGWNTHVLDTPYDWDGTSNIIVDICFQNPTFTNNGNSSSPFTTTTGFISAVYYRNNSTLVNACNTQFTTAIGSNRPNIQFTYCADPDPAAFTYQWTPNDTTINDTSIWDPIVTPPTTQSYTVIVGDTNGSVCADTSTVTVVVPTITTTPDTTMCPGSIQLSASIDTLTCPGTGQWQWSHDSLLNFDTIPNPIAFVDTTTLFTVTYTDTCGCTITGEVLVTVAEIAPLQLVTMHPTCGLDDGEVTINTSGGFPPYEYSMDQGLTWQVSNVFDSLSLGYYNFMVRDSLGCVSNIEYDTLINPGAPVIDSISPQDLSCFAANDGQINIYASGGVTPYTYSIDSGNTFGFTNLVNSLAGGNYYVVVKDANQCETFPAIPITLNEFTLLAIDSVITTNLSCFGNSSGQVEIYGSGGAGNTLFSIDGGMNFQTSNTFPALAAGTYNLMVQDSNGCTASAVDQLTEPQPITTSLTVIADSCFQSGTGSAAALAAGSNPPYNYAWSSGNTGPLATNLFAGAYVLTITDLNNCQFDTAFTVTQPQVLAFDQVVRQDVQCYGYNNGTITTIVTGGTGPYSYSFNGGTSFGATNTANNLAPAVYNVVVRDAHGCEITTSETITEPTEVVVTPTFTTATVCVGGCINISAPASGGGGGPYVYNWVIQNSSGFLGNAPTHNVCPTQNTTYEVHAQDANGCLSAVSIIQVNLFDSLSVTTVNDTDVCPGFTANLDASALGGDGVGFTYSWFPQTGLDNPNIANPKATPTQTTTYTVTINDFCGSPAITSQVTVTVNPVPVVEFISDKVEGCEPLSVQFQNQSSLINDCRWDFGDGRGTFECDPWFEFENPGAYDISLTVTSVDGCVTTLQKDDFITVHPEPEPKFEMSPNPTTLLNTKVQFLDKSKGDINFWNWNFNNLGTSAVRNPVFEFPATDTGSYNIQLDVTTVHGCDATTNLELKVGAEYLLWVPKAFSPNGDGLNDEFHPAGIGIKEGDYRLFIYDRWGHLVFESRNLNEPWDGKGPDGEVVANGTYVWRLLTTDFTLDENSYEYTGYVTVIK